MPVVTALKAVLGYGCSMIELIPLIRCLRMDLVRVHQTQTSAEPMPSVLYF